MSLDAAALRGQEQIIKQVYDDQGFLDLYFLLGRSKGVRLVYKKCL